MYKGLLRANEVRAIEMEDVDLNHGMKEITVKFTHKRKQRNDGFRYNIPSTFFSMFTRYIGQICMNTVRSGKVQFLKNWTGKGNRHIQNIGKYTVNKLHKVAHEILKHLPIGYTRKHLESVCRNKPCQLRCQFHQPKTSWAVDF